MTEFVKYSIPVSAFVSPQENFLLFQIGYEREDDYSIPVFQVIKQSNDIVEEVKLQGTLDDLISMVNNVKNVLESKK